MQRFNFNFSLNLKIFNMKKTVITAIAVFCLAGVQAQFEKGSKWIAGSGNISLGTSESNNGFSTSTGKTFAIGFRPSYNYFTSDKLMYSYV